MVGHFNQDSPVVSCALERYSAAPIATRGIFDLSPRPTAVPLARELVRVFHPPLLKGSRPWASVPPRCCGADRHHGGY